MNQLAENDILAEQSSSQLLDRADCLFTAGVLISHSARIFK